MWMSGWGADLTLSPTGRRGGEEKKKKRKKKKTVKMLPVRVLTRKRLIGSDTWCPAGATAGRGSQSWKGDRNQWEERSRFCLLSTWLTAWLARHGGQTPGRKHDRNAGVIKAARGLNVYNALLKSASRLSAYRGQYYTQSGCTAGAGYVMGLMQRYFHV